MASDNIELEDVDIFDITDPTNPVQVADIELADMFPQILDDEQANGAAVFNHDMIVKQIDGRFIMSVSNWDSGYVQIDVTDPANPTYVTDTTIGNDDVPSEPVRRGQRAPERVLGRQPVPAGRRRGLRAVPVRADRRDDRQVAHRDRGRRQPEPIADLPDRTMNGPTCGPATAARARVRTVPATRVPAAPADDGDPDTTDRADSAATDRSPSSGGTCDFAVKIDNAIAAGCDGVVIFNQVASRTTARST